MLQIGTRNVKDAYIDYAKKLLASCPEYWSRYKGKTPHYQVFKATPGKVIEVISYPRYRRIIEDYFKGAKHYVIQGETLALGNRLGQIAPRRVERNFANKQVDWKSTEKMWKDKGERKGLVYCTDEEWIRIAWKRTGKLKNSYLYKFCPAEGNKTGKGFKLEFTRANQENPFLKMKYEYFPYIREQVEQP